MSDAEALVQSLEDTSPASAAVIVPLLLELVGPRSVVDYGCGIGAWLAELRSCGIDDVLGVDTHDPGAQLLIPRDRFRVTDLERLTGSVGQADLALCLEVAEHLDASAAAPLVRALAGSAPVVAFSAAIPFQRGIHHTNLQWPGYWRELFAASGYRQLDVLRRRIWDDERIAFWYRQNLFLYASDEWLRAHPLDDRGDALPEHIVHPGLLRENDRIALDRQGISALVRELPRAAGRSLSRRRPGS